MNRIVSTLIAVGLALTGTLAGHAFAADAPAMSPASRGLDQDKVCTRCHDENDNKPILSIYQTKHGVKGDARTPACQSCHGTSDAHVKNAAGASTRPSPDVVFGGKKVVGSPVPVSSPQVQSEACLGCHKAGLRAHWDGSQHQSRDVPCASCHTAHAPKDAVLAKITQPEVCYACHKEQRAQSHRISTHPLDAGKMACTDCHNPHGSTGPTLLVKNSVNETCYTCHAEKRGPFLWEHGPVTDDCTNCHTPHGSTNTPLLKTRVPYLCQECHSGDHGAQLNSGANLANGNLTTINGINPLANSAPRAQLVGRACLNCHVQVHGSNHPGGSKFQR